MKRKSILSGIAVGLPLCTAAIAVYAAGVAPRVDLSSPATSPFPSNLFSMPDPEQLTGLRVTLPKPNCTLRESDCQDIDVINTWVHTLAGERFDLPEQIVAEMAKAKGVKSPPKLSVAK